MLLAAIVATSVNAAKATPAPSTGGLVIISGYSKDATQIATNGIGVVSPMTVSSSITQGKTNWHYRYISQGCPGYYEDLRWGNTANSLQLRFYGADGNVYGPYYDSSDGRIDGRIYLYVSQSGGLTGGYYYDEVYGYRVSGTQYYTI